MPEILQPVLAELLSGFCCRTPRELREGLGQALCLKAVRRLASLEAARRVSRSKRMLDGAGSEQANRGYRAGCREDGRLHSEGARQVIPRKAARLVWEAKGGSFWGHNHAPPSSQPGDTFIKKRKTQTQNRRLGDATRILVLGLLERKGEGFSRRAPRQDQIT
jgi:hypothetical protein